MQGLWKTKKTGYVKDYKIRKIKRKHFLKDKAKHVIKSLSSDSFILKFKRKENKYLTIEKEDFLNVYVVTFKKDNKIFIKKGYLNPITKEFEINENTLENFPKDRYEYWWKCQLFFKMPKDLQILSDSNYIEEIKIIGKTKNIFLEEINKLNNSIKTQDIDYYNNSYFYQNKLIDKNLYHQLLGKAYTGDSKYDLDGLTKADKKRMRRLETKKLIKEELAIYGYFDLAEIW